MELLFQQLLLNVSLASLESFAAAKLSMDAMAIQVSALPALDLAAEYDPPEYADFAADGDADLEDVSAARRRVWKPDTTELENPNRHRRGAHRRLLSGSVACLKSTLGGAGPIGCARRIDDKVDKVDCGSIAARLPRRSE
jgi:hypothetical protein